MGLQAVGSKLAVPNQFLGISDHCRPIAALLLLAGIRRRLPAAGLLARRGRTDVPRIVDWYMDGRVNIDDLITHKLPLDRINEGFDLMHEGKSIRSVVVY